MAEQALPFEALLFRLRNERFAIGVDSWLRVASLLEKCDGGIEPSRLRTILCPLFATDPEEQKRFGEIFDGYFPAVSRAGMETPKPRPDPERPAPRGKWYWKAAGAAALLCALGLGLTWQWRERPVTNPLRPSPQVIVEPNPKAQLPGPATPNPIQPTGTVNVRATPVDTSTLDRLRKLWLVPALLAGFYALWRVGRWVLGGYLVRQAALSARPAWSKTVAARAPIARAPEVARNVRRLRRPADTRTGRLDVMRTLDATVRSGGFPRFCYRSGARRSEYLVLIDRVSPRDHQAELFNRLVSTLRERGQLQVEQYFFTRDPRVCVSAKTGKPAYLADLLSCFPTHRVLVFGDGEALWNSLSGEPTSWAGMLLDRPQMALMTPHIDGWDAREHGRSG